MRRWAFLFILCLVIVLTNSTNDTVISQESEPSFILADLSYEVYPGFSRIILTSNEKIEVLTYELQNPYRVVIDLVGVYFCELEERADYTEGLITSIEVIAAPDGETPAGMDDFFYPVDYIIITPVADVPYRVSTAEDGKLLLVDFGKKELQELIEFQEKRVEETPIPTPTDDVEPIPSIEIMSELIDEPIIDRLYYEVLDESSLLIIASDKSIYFTATKRYYPRFGFILEPDKTVYTDLEQKAKFEGGVIRSLKIIKAHGVKRPRALDKYYYPIKYIVVEPAKDMFYDFYTNEDSTVSVLEIPHLGTEGAVLVSPPAVIRPQVIEEEEKAAVPVVREEVVEEVVPPKEERPRELMQEKIEDKLAEIGEARELLEEEEVVPPKEERPRELMEEKIEDELAEIGETRELLEEEEVLSEKEEIPEAGPEKAAMDKKTFVRRQLIEELKDDIRREDLEKKRRERETEEYKEERKRQEEDRKLQAEIMSKQIRKEILKDAIVTGKGFLTLMQCQKIGLSKSPTVKTAEDEISLGRAKKREAFRAMFPQVKVKGTHTTGDVLEVDFIEEVYGVQAEQPIYQGGRLLNTYKQSKANLRVAETRYQKVKTDLEYKIAEAYYNTITAVMNLRLQQDLLEKAKGVLAQAEGRYEVELSTKLEVLNVRSQFNQIQFQIASSERDLALSRFKLRQAMSLDLGNEELELGEVDTDLEFKIIDVDLEKCIDLAIENQPDILVSKSLFESNEYGEKIAKGKAGIKLDVTGFYGQSGSHYETEERSLDADWNIGVKVSRPFWSNTASYSYSQEETSRKVGQTDRTGSEVNSGEFGILDAMTVASDIKEARLNKAKTENDLIDTRRQVILEAKEAYYTYQEAIIQVKNSLEKVKFQEEAVKTATAQAQLNEALQSQMLEAMVKSMDERSIYTKALSDYNLAIAKLNKAVGIADYFKID